MRKRLRDGWAERVDLTRKIWREWCISEVNWAIRRGGRSFYAWKALAVVWLGRYRDYDYYDRASIQIAYISYETGTNWEYWNSASWDILVVPRGFRGWCWTVSSDSTP